MDKTHLTFIGIFLLLNLPIVAANENPYSVGPGDNLTYLVKDQGDEGIVEINVDSFRYSEANQDEEITGITGQITGEYSDDITSTEVKYGWRSLLYVDINSSISFDGSAISLHSMIYEFKLPFVWPANDEFYENLDFGSGHNYELIVEKQGAIWLITEQFDQSPVDGCLCETKVEVENGILRSLIQNETFFFAPSMKIAYITLEALKTENTTSLLPVLEFISILVLIPIINLRKRII